MKLVVGGENAKVRLDKYLSQENPDISRSQIQKLIKNEKVFVNGEVTSVHYFLKEGDEIQFEISEGAVRMEKDIKIEVVAEEKEYLVVNKPAGVIVHPGEGIKEKTMIEYLVDEYKDIKEIGESDRPGIVHRLDKEVSGLMIVARDMDFFHYIKKQFEGRKIVKKYIALVYGEMVNDESVIDTPLQTGKGKTVVRSDRGALVDEIKDAVTEYEVIKRFKNYTLLEVNIKTGRTHQIRAHMLSIGHPVVGDVLYKSGSKSSTIIKRQKRDRQVLGRVFLHSAFVGFDEMGGLRREYESKLPQMLVDFMESTCS